jgi:hypothetical protein
MRRGRPPPDRFGAGHARWSRGRRPRPGPPPGPRTGEGVPADILRRLGKTSPWKGEIEGEPHGVPNVRGDLSDGSVKIPKVARDVPWDYDDEADVRSPSIDKPRPAIGVEIGGGVVLRYDESRNELVGPTIIGPRAALPSEPAEAP